MASGAIRTVYRQARGKRAYNGNGKIKFQTKPSRIVCPYCYVIVAPQDKQIKTVFGQAHYNCVVDQVFERLKSQKLPLPSILSLGRDFQEYLVDQAEILLRQPVEDAEYKLTEILDISEEIFGVPIQLSKLMARQSQGLSS